MNLITVLLRLTLSAVFGTAGVTKLLDQSGTRDAVKNFGAPPALVPALSILLPIAELAIAAGLLFESGTRASALGALVVLGIFIVAIGINLARGNTHDCHCFGQLYSRPLGWSTLARNVVFALGAGFVFWRTEVETTTGIVGTLSRMSLAQWLGLLGVLVGVGAAMIYLRYRHKHSPEPTAPALKGLPIDAVAPAFELTTYAGGTTSLTELLGHGKPLLLLFTSPTCGPCVVLFEEIKKWQETHNKQVTIALLSSGTIKENFVNVARNGLGQVLLQEKREVAEKYGANVTPTGVIVTTEGKIASPIAAGAEEIRNLLATLLGNSHGSHNHHEHS